MLDRRGLIVGFAAGVCVTLLFQTLVGGQQQPVYDAPEGPPPPRAAAPRRRRATPPPPDEEAAAPPVPNATSRAAAARGGAGAPEPQAPAPYPTVTGLEPTPVPTPAPPLSPDELASLEDARKQNAAAKYYDLAYTEGMPECHPRCQLPDLQWRAYGPPGKQRDQFGTLLQWDTDRWGERTFSTRVACLVAIGPRQHRLWEVIADTWGRHCDGLFYVFSTAEKEEAEKHKDPRWSFLLVPMQRPDNDIHGGNKKRTNFWEKVWRMWLRAANELTRRFDWFYKGDSDTWASIPNLRRFAQFYNPDQAIYFGHTHLKRWGSENGFFNAGCGYVLSSGALRRVGHVLRHIRTTQLPLNWPSHCVDRPGAGEDVTFSFCLRAAGVPPMNTLDHRLRQRFLTFQHRDHYSRMPYPADPVGDYFWQGKPRKIGKQENCCADEPIAFHNYKDATREQYMELEKRFGAPASKPVAVPPRLQCFLYDESIAPKYDAHRNIAEPPKGQVVYKRPGELECAPPDWSEFTPFTPAPT